MFTDPSLPLRMTGQEESPQRVLGQPPPKKKEQLSDGSLIKWENKNNPRVLRMDRELIWVAYHKFFEK